MTYRASSNTGNDANTTTKAGPVPSVFAGDIVTATVTRWTNTGAFTTLPTGFFDWGTTFTSSDGQANMHVFWKRVTVNSDATDEPDGLYQFGWAAGSNDWSHLHLYSHSGRLTTGVPIEAIGVGTPGAAGTYGTASVNCTAGADLIWDTYNDSSGTHTPPTGSPTWTERIDFDSGAGATRDNASGGTNTAVGGTSSSTSPALAVLISLPPAAVAAVSDAIKRDKQMRLGALMQM